MAKIVEVVASCLADDAKVERIMDRLIKPEFDSFGWSEGRMEWTWDFDDEGPAQELMVILGRVAGVTAKMNVYPDAVQVAAAA